MAGKANPGAASETDLPIPFNKLFEQTGLSVRQVAGLLRVRPDTIIHWRKGRRTAPEGVLQELEEWLRDSA